tara:strand:- start:173 stop:532 length:360 start_codon:yes stop_codon:yes gene_type:complete
MKPTEKEIIKGVKSKVYSVKEKQIVVVYFDFEYPMNPKDIEQVTQTISNIINSMSPDFINRVIFLPKGFDMYNLSEDDFIKIWKSKVDSKKVDELLKDDKIEKDENQMELFKTDTEVIE